MWCPVERRPGSHSAAGPDHRGTPFQWSRLTMVSSWKPSNHRRLCIPQSKDRWLECEQIRQEGCPIPGGQTQEYRRLRSQPLRSQPTLVTQQPLLYEQGVESSHSKDTWGNHRPLCAGHIQKEKKPCLPDKPMFSGSSSLSLLFLALAVSASVCYAG